VETTTDDQLAELLMNRNPSKQPELAIPLAALRALRTRLAADVGTDAAARALRAAGHAAGDAFFATLAAAAGARSAADRDRLAELDSVAFWRKLGDFFAARGWGRLRFLEVHEGVGALESSDWAEADDGEAQRPSCHLTTGLLANLLGNIAERPVAVLEAECRSRGDSRCVFLFGAPETMNVVHGDLAAGSDLDRALLELV
jgi:predicted hydrocarbon binding protein